MAFTFADVTNLVIEKSLEDSPYGSSETDGATGRVVGRKDYTITITQLNGGAVATLMVGSASTVTITMGDGTNTCTFVGPVICTKISPVVDINTGSVEKFEIELKGNVTATGLVFTGDADISVPISAKNTTIAWA
jgi:hypothetical protein